MEMLDMKWRQSTWDWPGHLGAVESFDQRVVEEETKGDNVT